MPSIPPGSAVPPAPVPAPPCPGSAARPRGCCLGLGPLSAGGAKGIWSAGIIWWFLPPFGFCPDWSETKAFPKLPANWQLLAPRSSRRTAGAPSPCQSNPHECPFLSTRSRLSRLLHPGLPCMGPQRPGPRTPGSQQPPSLESHALQRLHHSPVLWQRGGFLHPRPCESIRSVIPA